MGREGKKKGKDEGMRMEKREEQGDIYKYGEKMIGKGYNRREGWLYGKKEETLEVCIQEEKERETGDA